MQNYFRTQALGAGKRVRTRGTLIDSAIDVFSEKGIEEASINEITALAGMANGTFYNHFKDKDDLAVASSGAIALEIARQLDLRMSDLDEGISRVVVASWAFLTIALSNRAWAQVLVEQYQRHAEVDESTFSYMRADIERAAKQRELGVVVDTLLLEQLASLMMVALRRLLREGMREEILVRTCEYMLRILGLTPVQAKKEVEKVSGHSLLEDGASNIISSSE